MPGSVANCRRSSASSSLPRPTGLAQADVDFGRLDALHVLVEFGAAGAARRRDHFGLGQQDLLDAAADLVGLRERGARQRVGLHGQAAFVELRQERRAGARQCRPARATSSDRRDGHDRVRMVERRRQARARTAP